jgi:hypothetical protein
LPATCLSKSAWKPLLPATFNVVDTSDLKRLIGLGGEYFLVLPITLSIIPPNTTTIPPLIDFYSRSDISLKRRALYWADLDYSQVHPTLHHSLMPILLA